MLLELFNEQTVKIHQSVKDWIEAGHVAGDLLVKENIVEPKFIDAMIESVKKFGPYIVLTEGVALFHARPNEGVIKMGMSLVVLKEGVSFNVPDKDPVYLIFVLAPENNESHLAALADFAKILEDSEAINKIKNAQNYDEIMDVVKSKLQ
ncbi:MAG TPA: PTS sugar transporter subunit IIA [Haloplasmataceae bacterium]